MTKFFNKFKKPCSEPIFGPFSQFWRQKRFFLENPTLSGTTSYGFLEPCQNLEKTNDIIPRKSPYRRMNGRTEGQKGGQTLFHRIKKTRKTNFGFFTRKSLVFYLMLSQKILQDTGKKARHIILLQPHLPNLYESLASCKIYCFEDFVVL